MRKVYKKGLYIIVSLIIFIVCSYMFVFNGSDVTITTYAIDDIPNELIEIISKQSYPAIYVDEIEKNIFLVHDSRSKNDAFINISISARVRNRSLNIKIKKKQNWDEASNNTAEEMVSVIEVPNSQTITNINLKENFSIYTLWKNMKYS